MVGIFYYYVITLGEGCCNDGTETGLGRFGPPRVCVFVRVFGIFFRS
jgi:hypothetical protein